MTSTPTTNEYSKSEALADSDAPPTSAYVGFVHGASDDDGYEDEHFSQIADLMTEQEALTLYHALTSDPAVQEAIGQVIARVRATLHPDED